MIYREATMKPIVFKESNYPKIEDEIKAVEGKATARRITTALIAYEIAKIERELSIPKKYMKGVKAHVDYNAQSFPKAYKYTPVSTHVKLEHTGSYWKVVDIWRDECQISGREIVLTLTEDAKSAIIAKYTHF